jgi:hypothetical protein
MRHFDTLSIAILLLYCYSNVVPQVGGVVPLLDASQLLIFFLAMMVNYLQRKFLFLMWEPSMGSSHRLPNRYRGNAYANRYPSNSPINRISMITNNRNNSCIVASGVYTWVRLKTSAEIYGLDFGLDRNRSYFTTDSVSMS